MIIIIIEICLSLKNEMRREYYDPIERFPEKIDQLLDALSSMFIIC